MELRHLRYFTAVAENLNFSEASRRIHVAQPAISQTILDLEEEIGVRLLVRDRRTVRLTAAGQIFRRLRIGFYGSAVSAFLPLLVREYHRRFPDVELTLLELTNTQQLEAFDQGELDIGFCRPLPAERSSEFNEELIYTDYLYLVLPSGHPLARNLTPDRTIHIKRLSAERFVLLQRQAAQELYDEKLAFCRCMGNFSPQVVNESDRTSTVLLLVESGIGVSIVAGHVRHLVRAGGLVVFCRLQPASAPVELRLSWRRGKPSSPTVEAFRKLVQSQREAIRTLMEPRPSERKQRKGAVA
jgi:DNA-binding transcriptional LysR family regulator